MSYDLSIFFPQVSFPARVWNEILMSFSGPDCQVIPADVRSAGIGIECGGLFVNEKSSVHAEVMRTKPGGTSCAPPGAHWSAVISTSAGRPLTAWWLQFAIPYHALVMIPGVTVHDCQHHLVESMETSSFTDPDAWRNFAAAQIWDRRARHLTLNGRNLFADDRSPSF